MGYLKQNFHFFWMGDFWPQTRKKQARNQGTVEKRIANSDGGPDGLTKWRKAGTILVIEMCIEIEIRWLYVSPINGIFKTKLPFLLDGGGGALPLFWNKNFKKLLIKKGFLKNFTMAPRGRTSFSFQIPRIIALIIIAGPKLLSSSIIINHIHTYRL